MLSRIPITVSAPLLIGVPVLVVGVWLSLMWNEQSHEAVRELADQEIEQIHAFASSKVGDVLSIPVRICEVNAHLIRMNALDPEDLESWRPTFARVAHSFDALSAISWGAADGRTAWISRYPDGSVFWALKAEPDSPTMLEWRVDERGAIPLTTSSEFEFDVSTRPWFTTPRDRGEPTWSEPFVWVGGDGADPTLGIAYGIPIYGPDGAFVGVIDADFSLNDLSAFLRTIDIGKTGVAALFDEDGHLLATSTHHDITTSEGERLHASESEHALIAATADYAAQADHEADRLSTIDIEGDTHLIHVAPIGHEIGLNWSLATIVPESDFVGGIEASLRRSSVTSIAAVGIAVIVGVVAARWLVGPLLTLVTAVRRIGQGDLETRVQLRHAPEYTNLADEINEMAVGLQDRMRMRESLSLAMEVQKNLLPAKAPKINGLDVAGHSTYCDETGGDYYDYLDVSGVDDDSVVVAMGDVMGHGVAAAMLMATARGVLRSRCTTHGSLADFLGHLNEMLVHDTAGQRFMTMQLMTISSSTHEIRWASAGHGPPIVYDPRTDSFPEYEGGGLPLGVMDGEEYEEYTESGIGKGCVILAATDGLWEAKAEDGELYGMERVQDLIRTIAKKSSREISEAIRDALARHRGESAPDDDLTFVVVKVE